MCLSVPAKILNIEGSNAKATVGGSIINVSLQLVENIEIGDYVLVHTGFALEKLMPKLPGNLGHAYQYGGRKSGRHDPVYRNLTSTC